MGFRTSDPQIPMHVTTWKFSNFTFYTGEAPNHPNMKQNRLQHFCPLLGGGHTTSKMTFMLRFAGHTTFSLRKRGREA